VAELPLINMCGIIGTVQFVGKLLCKEAPHRRFSYFYPRGSSPDYHYNIASTQIKQWDDVSQNIVFVSQR